MPRHEIGKTDLSDYATKDYVDDGTWLFPPIIEWYDPTGGLPEDPEVGDRYGADATAEGWTIDYIYEWDGIEWVESEPEEGWMVWVLWELLFYVFFSGGWMEVGESSQNHQITATLPAVVGSQAVVRLPMSGTITSAIITGDISGSAVVDIWKDTYTNYPPTVADTITASAKPTLSSAIKATDSTLTGWTKTFSAGDWMIFNVDSCDTLSKIYIVLTYTR